MVPADSQRSYGAAGKFAQAVQDKQAARMLVTSESGKTREQAAKEATAIHHLLFQAVLQLLPY
jgi:formylmethanofuran:tetrahydromethanopterin formyltransferase